MTFWLQSFGVNNPRQIVHDVGSPVSTSIVTTNDAYKTYQSVVKPSGGWFKQDAFVVPQNTVNNAFSANDFLKRSRSMQEILCVTTKYSSKPYYTKLT